MDEIREAIKELLGLKDLPEGEDLSGFSEEQLEQAAEKAMESFRQAKDDKDLQAATEAHAVAKAIQAEGARRDEEAAQIEEKFAELESDLEVEDEADAEAGDGDDDGKGDDEGKDDEAADDGADDDGKVSAEDETDAEEAAEEKAKVEAKVNDAKEPEAVAAAIKTAVKTKPRSKGKPRNSTPLAVLTAAADVKDHSVGSAITVNDLSEAFVSRAEALLATGKIASQSALATARVKYPENRKLDPQNTAEANSNIINPVVLQAQEETFKTLRRMAMTDDLEELEELTAAGGLCAPVDTRYDIMQIGDDVRPLRDSLPRFNARRGGIRYVVGTSIPLPFDITGSYENTVDGSVAIYTEADDTTGSRYPKDCLRVECPTWEEVVVKAITLCMITGTWQRLTYPEAFRAWWRAGQVLFARTAETELWDDMVALSTAITAGEGLGATSDVLSQVGRAATQLRWRFRINPKTPMRLWAPDFLKEIMKTDLARRQPGDGLADTLGATDAQLARYFAARNIAVSFVLDGQSPGGASGDIQSAGALNPWPSTVDTILAPEGTFIGLDMGQLNFGTEIRDFDMIRQNDVGAFYESFENVAKVGPQAFKLNLNICPDGTTAGPDADFDPCTLGS